MNTSQTAILSRSHSSTNYCHGYFAERGALYFLRGIAAALLLPLEMLQYVRWGNQVDRKTKFSWMLSLLMLLALGGMWLFSTSSPAQGVDCGSILLACCAVVVAVAIGNGRLQMFIKNYGSEVRGERGPEQIYGGYGRHGGHRGSHGWTRHPRGRLGTGGPSFVEYGSVALGQRMKVFPWREVASSQPSAQMSGVCISNCKACNEPVCVRSGTARNRRSIG